MITDRSSCGQLTPIFLKIWKIIPIGMPACRFKIKKWRNYRFFHRFSDRRVLLREKKMCSSLRIFSLRIFQINRTRFCYNFSPPIRIFLTRTLSFHRYETNKRWRVKFERMAEQDRRGINSEMLKDPKVEGATDDRHFRHRSQHVPGDLGSADDASNNNRSIMSPNGILGLHLDAANSFVLDVPPTPSDKL